MRTTILLTASILLVSFPLVTADDPAFACHDWEVVHGDPNGTSLAVSTDDGAVYASLRPDEPILGEEAVYVVSDGTASPDGGPFSAWVYTEENGEAGLQRGAGDDPCEGSEEFGHDCFVSCTF